MAPVGGSGHVSERGGCLRALSGVRVESVAGYTCPLGGAFLSSVTNTQEAEEESGLETMIGDPSFICIHKVEFLLFTFIILIEV